MGNISTILAAILCATAPLASVKPSDSKVEQAQSTFKLGKEMVSAVRETYKKGEYSEFLSQMDRSYKETDLEGLVQMRQKEIPVNFQEKWDRRFSDLQKEKNKELLNALSDKDDSVFAKKVRSLAANICTPEQEKALSRLNSLIVMAPNTGANDDENTLINIDMEYEYKLIHAQLPNSNVSPEQRQQQQIALRMEKMDKMVAASKSFQDQPLKQAVGLAAATLDARLARNLDGADINALVKSKVKPSNEGEEKIYSVITSYQGQFSDLMKELGHANQ